MSKQKYITNQVLDEHKRAPICTRCAWDTQAHYRTRVEIIEFAEAQVANYAFETVSTDPNVRRWSACCEGDKQKKERDIGGNTTNDRTSTRRIVRNFVVERDGGTSCQLAENQVQSMDVPQDQKALTIVTNNVESGKEYISHTGKFLCNMATTKTTRAMRLSARPITASTTSGTTRATSTSPSTTPMTMVTSTIAWCTPCVERARRAHSFTLDVVSHLMAQDLSLIICHRSYPWAHLLDSPLPFYFYLFFPVFSFHLLHSELHPELDNPIIMESLCYSANKVSDDAYDVSTPPLSQKQY